MNMDILHFKDVLSHHSHGHHSHSHTASKYCILHNFLSLYLNFKVFVTLMVVKKVHTE